MEETEDDGAEFYGYAPEPADGSNTSGGVERFNVYE